MGIELRPVNTYKSGFTVDSDTAGTTHSCAVNHYGVERADSRNSVFFGQLCHKLHHYRRADRDNLIDLLALYNLAQTICDETFLTGRAVVSHDYHLVAPGFDLIA